MGEASTGLFGVVLRRYRVAAGLSQEALAARARLSWRAISDLERGWRHLPRRETARLLTEALNLSPLEQAEFEQAARGMGALAVATAGAPGIESHRSPFVGRAGEVTLLESHLAGEGPPIQLLAGEPGIG